MKRKRVSGVMPPYGFSLPCPYGSLPVDFPSQEVTDAPHRAPSQYGFVPGRPIRCGRMMLFGRSAAGSPAFCRAVVST